MSLGITSNLPYPQSAIACTTARVAPGHTSELQIHRIFSSEVELDRTPGLRDFEKRLADYRLFNSINTVELKGARYYLGDIFKLEHNRIATLFKIEINGNS